MLPSWLEILLSSSVCELCIVLGASFGVALTFALSQFFLNFALFCIKYPKLLFQGCEIFISLNFVFFLSKCTLAFAKFLMISVPLPNVVN